MVLESKSCDGNYDEQKISIIVPIYNAEKYLKRCLEDIKNQTYQDFEAILIDDGSTDGSVNICEEFVNQDKRFRYIHQENAGPDIARKKGTKSAGGAYVTYVDADDRVADNMLEVMYDALNTSKADVVCSQIVRFNEKKQWDGTKYREETVTLSDKQEIYKAFFIDEILIGTYYAKLIKTSIMRSYEFVEDGLIGEDITAALWLFDRADKIVVIPNKTYYYFQNELSISHSKYSYRHEISLNNYIKLRDDWVRRDYVSEYRICGYFAGYQMAVATAMGRNGEYIGSVGEVLRHDLGDKWQFIKGDGKTQLYMKMCIWLYIHMPKLFIRLYRILYLVTGR